MLGLFNSKICTNLESIPPQLKSGASVPIFCGRECLYPMPLSTCLNIYFVNRDVSRFYSFLPPLSRGKRSPPPEGEPFLPVSLPMPSTPTLGPISSGGFPPAKALPQLGEPQLGEGERRALEGVGSDSPSPPGGGLAFPHPLAAFPAAQVELRDLKRMAATFRSPFLLTGLPLARPTPRPDGAGPRGPGAPKSRAPGHSGLLPGAVVGPAPQTHPVSPELPEMQRLAPID